MSKQLKQVLGLSKKTGDRIIVFDNSDPDNSFVVMTLDQYEKLVDPLTSKKIVDKISNNDNDSSVNNNGWKIPKQIKEESEE